MSVEQLLREFGRVGESAAAVDKLRRLIVEFALQGHLSAPDAADEPAKVLFDRIQKLRQTDGRRREGALRAVLPTCDAPTHWETARLGEVIRLVSGQHLKPAEYSAYVRGALPYVTGPADFGRSGLVITRQALVRKAVAKRGQILLTGKGAGVGKTALCDLAEVAISRQLMALQPIEVNTGFLLLTTQRLADRLKASARSLIPGIGRDDVNGFSIGLPPLAEQARIVARVAELMSLCDALAAALSECDSARDRLRATSLMNIVSSTDMKHARFVLRHAPRILKKPADVASIRAAIWDLAVRGRLATQDSVDAPCPTNLVITGPAPFHVPAAWRWLTVGQVGTARLGKMLDKAKNTGKPHLYLRNVNVRWFDFDLTDLKTMPFEERELDELSLVVGDVLVCEGGEPGRAAVWDGRQANVYFQKALHRVRLVDWFEPHFLVIYLRARASAGDLVSHSTGATFKHLTGQALSTLPVPVPPFAEQRRIVARVNELMTVCDSLERSLAAEENERARLLEALLNNAVVPRGGARSALTVSV